MFEVGKKVVCVATGWRLSLDSSRGSMPGPRKYEILETLEVAMSDDPIAGLCLHLAGYELHENGRKNWYSAVSFRPLESMPDFTAQIEAQQQQETIEILTPEMV